MSKKLEKRRRNKDNLKLRLNNAIAARVVGEDVELLKTRRIKARDTRIVEKEKNTTTYVYTILKDLISINDY